MTRLAQLDREQRRVLDTIITQGRRRKVSFPELVAAVSTGLVEAGLRNPNYGDGTSIGWRQETASSYPGVNRRDVKASVERFFNETARNRGRYPNYAKLAQSVQRSAFPGRYAERGGEAKDLIRQWSRTHSGPDKTAVRTARPGTKTVTVKPAVDNSAARNALLLQYVTARPADASKDTGNLLNLGLSLKDAQDQPAITKTVKAPAPARGGTTGGVPGRPRRLQGGPVNEIVRIGEWFQRLGQSVREQPRFDRVDPVHVQGSYHYKNRAIDVPVTGNRGRQLAEWLQKAYPQAQWIWNGPQPKSSRGKINYPNGHQDHIHVQI